MNKGSIGIFINRVITASILFSLFLGGTPPKVVHAQGNIRYVTPGGLMEGECDSWVNACELQYALGIALAGDELWVAQGTYHPGAAGERESTFQLKTGVDIYGGFAGDEGSLEERDWLNNVVILSGDLNDNGIDDYDSYHVVKGADNAILDGVTVSGGNANGEVPNNLGAGMYNEYSNPSLNHVIFAGNTVVSGSGGGMYNRYSSPSLINVTFDGNSSDWFGGGLLNNASNPILSNTSFISNTAYYGGGITNFSNSSPSLTNVTFAGNIAEEGGGMNNRNSSPSLINVTFYGNTAEWGGGIANFESDFMMTNVTFSDNIAHYGGGMFNFTSMPSIINVTIVNNTAAMGGAIYNDDGSFSMIYNSIIWGNGDQFEGPPNARYSDIEVGEGEPLIQVKEILTTILYWVLWQTMAARP